MENRNPYIDFWFLLVAALLIVSLYSFVKEPISVSLKQSGVSDFLFPDTTSYAADIQEENLAPKMDSTAQSILLIGDSMLEGLSPAMLAYAKQNGHELNSVVWYSSTTKYFGESDTLRHFIKQFKPTYIFLSIGANELMVGDIKKHRASFVNHIIKSCDTIPYIWIGPPNWREDTGINEMILEQAGKRRYFPSKDLTFERARDGAHPTRASARNWMDSLARWVADSSAHPILMDKPSDSLKVKGNGIRVVLQPLK